MDKFNMSIFKFKTDGNYMTIPAGIRFMDGLFRNNNYTGRNMGNRKEVGRKMDGLGGGGRRLPSSSALALLSSSSLSSLLSASTPTDWEMASSFGSQRRRMMKKKLERKELERKESERKESVKEETGRKVTERREFDRKELMDRKLGAGGRRLPSSSSLALLSSSSLSSLLSTSAPCEGETASSFGFQRRRAMKEDLERKELERKESERKESVKEETGRKVTERREFDRKELMDRKLGVGGRRLPSSSSLALLSSSSLSSLLSTSAPLEGETASSFGSQRRRAMKEDLERKELERKELEWKEYVKEETGRKIRERKEFVRKELVEEGCLKRMDEGIGKEIRKEETLEVLDKEEKGMEGLGVGGRRLPSSSSLARMSSSLLASLLKSSAPIINWRTASSFGALRRKVMKEELERKELERKETEGMELERKEMNKEEMDRKGINRKETESKESSILDGSIAPSPLIGEDFPLFPLPQRITRNFARKEGDWRSSATWAPPPVVNRGVGVETGRNAYEDGTRKSDKEGIMKKEGMKMVGIWSGRRWRGRSLKRRRLKGRRWIRRGWKRRKDELRLGVPASLVGFAILRRWRRVGWKRKRWRERKEMDRKEPLGP